MLVYKKLKLKPENRNQTMPTYHINQKSEVEECKRTSCKHDHFEESKMLTLKTSLDKLFTRKEEPKNSWAAGYKAMLTEYLTTNGTVNDGYETRWGMLMLKQNPENDSHFKTCEKGQTITHIKEETFSIPGWDSFRTPDDVPVALVTGKATCGCGKVTNITITVQENIHSILLAAFNNDF